MSGPFSFPVDDGHGGLWRPLILIYIDIGGPVLIMCFYFLLVPMPCSLGSSFLLLNKFLLSPQKKNKNKREKGLLGVGTPCYVSNAMPISNAQLKK